MTKLFIYNFAGRKYESHVAFDDTFREMLRECKANGQEDDITRQVIIVDWQGKEIIENQRYNRGVFLNIR